MRKHGTMSCYSNDGCRCMECKAAWASYKRDYNKRSFETHTFGKHGTTSAYTRGCRCSDCRSAAVSYQRNYRARSRSAS